MLAKKLINTEIAPLKSNDRFSEARLRMEKLDVNTLPVVDSTTNKLIGQVTAQMIEREESSGTISDLELEEPVKIYYNQHIFEAVRLMLQYEMRLIGVVDKEWTLEGMILKSMVLESLSRMLNLAGIGSVITIELPRRDFTLSEIVHIIETEGAKILGITVETPEAESKNFQVSIKLNVKDVSRVASALRRYEYTVVTESGNEAFGMDVETRADELIKYLDM